jgi:hypothetical protein
MTEKRRVYEQEQTIGDAAVMGAFDPTQGHPVVGSLIHLAVSGVYGVLFAVLYRGFSRRWSWASARGWILGLVYGLVLFLVAESALGAGIDTAFAEVSKVNTALFHLIYGLALGLFLERKRLGSVV